MELRSTSSVTDEAKIPSDDGSERYLFNAQGRHLRTYDTLTGSVRFQFDYDARGRLSMITDAFGNQTTIEHDMSGNPR